MTTEPLYCIARQPAARSEGGSPLLVLLHGYGSNEEDLIGLAPHLDPRFLTVSARAPRALDMGGFAWFPVDFTPFGLVLDYAQATAARAQIAQLLEEWRARPEVDPERVFLLGFSQGASMALSAALHRPELVAGAVLLSGLVVPQMLPEGNLSPLRGLPLLMVHGRQDPLIPVSQGRGSRELVGRLPVALSYREYDMGHEISQECLEEVSDWLVERLEKKQDP